MVFKSLRNKWKWFCALPNYLRLYLAHLATSYLRSTIIAQYFTSHSRRDFNFLTPFVPFLYTRINRGNIICTERCFINNCLKYKCGALRSLTASFFFFFSPATYTTTASFLPNPCQLG